jgi:2-keto-4-pentenoate hydratase/2-oxohepta-3-ene-1,7-dioic acid hydratase in catechol pathway
MRYLSFSVGGSPPRAGFMVDDDAVRPFADGVPSLDDFIAFSPERRADAIAAASGPIAMNAVTLLAPLRPKKNVFCVGRNYLAHAQEGATAQNTALDLPSVPTYFSKGPTSIASPDQTIHLSARVSKQYDWEGELGVVIGSRCKDVEPGDALAAIFGYLCLNDITARDLQRAHGQWFKGKTLDESCPIGPWIVAADDVGDAQALDITLRVNGVVKQHSNTRHMIFPLAEIISSLSAGLTLDPGDVIASGTPEGVGYARTPPEFFADGDVVEVEIERVGTLRNAIEIRPWEERQ